MPVLRVLWLVYVLGVMLPARAHDPFDGNGEVVVTDHRITVTLTLGYDAARAVLAAQQLPAETSTGLARSGGRRQVSLPLAGAPQLVAIEAGGAPLAATSFLVAPDEVEFTFQIVYPRPGGATVLLRAGYFTATEFMRPGTVLVVDQHRRLLARSVVSAAAPTAELPLVLAPGAAVLADARSVVAPDRAGPDSGLDRYDGMLVLGALAGALLVLRRRRMPSARIARPKAPRS